MKGLTKKLKQEAVDKWQEIVNNIEAFNISFNYVSRYWVRCSFCRAVKVERKGCRECSLNSDALCNNTTASHSHHALFSADVGEWKCALKNAKQILKAIQETGLDTELDTEALDKN